ncbi:glycosyltransferase family 2 protein [bacterium]|nr:glycosyltransferase family 2 protein [bacterium]
MISIIIVNYNQKNFLEECLKSIKEANISINYEIIIIDNHSKDDSLNFLGKLDQANVRVIFNPENFGFSYAVNQGIRISRGEYLLILNPDIIVLPKSVENLYQFMEKNQKVGIAGPKLINPDKTLQFSCFRFPKFYIPFLRRSFLGKIFFFKKVLQNYLLADYNHKEPKEVDWLLGAALFVRKKALKDVGLMDERYFLYFEDVDWCRRFHLKGWQVFYYPKSKMIHFYQRLSAQKRGIKKFFDKIMWIHLISGIKYFRKWSAKNKLFSILLFLIFLIYVV